MTSKKGKVTYKYPERTKKGAVKTFRMITRGHKISDQQALGQITIGGDRTELHKNEASWRLGIMGNWYPLSDQAKDWINDNIKLVNVPSL